MIQENRSFLFLRSLQANAQKKRRPLRVLFELTYDCNFDCIHCYVPECHRKSETLAKNEIFLILDQLQELGCFHLGLSGGEIFLRKDILDILWYAKKKGFNLILLTNGSLIDRGIADEIEKIAPNKVDITLHSLHRGRFEAISRIKGSFEKVLRSIELLHRRKVPLGIKNCSLPVNQDDLAEVREFAKKLKAVVRVGAGVISSSQDVCNLDESQEAILREGFSPPRSKQRFNAPQLFPCRAGIHSMVINPQGQLKLCPNIDYPLIHASGGNLADAWRKLNTAVNKIENDYHASSQARGRSFPIRWCPAKSWVKYGNFTQTPLDARNTLEKGTVRNIAEAVA